MMSTTNIIAQYQSAFREHGRSSAAVLCPKGRHGLRFDALLAQLDASGKTLLDFGCGLGHLCEHLRQRNIDCQYYGVDVVPEFIASNRAVYPGRNFQQISDISDVTGRFNIILASGVFNLRYLDDPAANRAYVEAQILALFDRCDEALTLDFMTSHVDFKREEAFHADPADMLGFAIEKLSRRVVIDHSYMPFEFCMTVFRKNAIDRVGAVYG
jgi:SAM-dependent methyltransferase